MWLESSMQDASSLVYKHWKENKSSYVHINKFNALCLFKSTWNKQVGRIILYIKTMKKIGLGDLLVLIWNIQCCFACILIYLEYTCISKIVQSECLEVKLKHVFMTIVYPLFVGVFGWIVDIFMQKIYILIHYSSRFCIF